jgi:nucleoside-diphosphate-sugar epimerase
VNNILVTGARGFVGSVLVNKLLQSGFTVTAVDRILGKERFETNLSVVKSDIQEEFLTDDIIKDHDVVIHLANSARIEPSWQTPEEYFYNNITVTGEFFRRCQQLNVKKFIHFSSSSVYGNNQTDIQLESSNLSPTNPYAVSKAAAEMLLSAYQLTGNMSLIIVRPFTMYDTTMSFGKDALAIGKFIKAYSQGQPLEIHGTGNQKRDFLYLDDAIDGVLLLINHAQCGVFNLGRGQSVSIKEIANVISGNQIYVSSRPGPEYNTCADITKLKELGFKPKVDILDWLNIQKQNNFKEFSCH